MAKRSIDENIYNQMLCDEGVFYPMIFCGNEQDGFSVFMPIRDDNDDISAGYGISFTKAYEVAREYLVMYRMQYGKFPKYVNPYRIDIDLQQRPGDGPFFSVRHSSPSLSSASSVRPAASLASLNNAAL